MIQGGTIQVQKRETEMVRDVIEELTAYSTLPLHTWSFQYTHTLRTNNELSLWKLVFKHMLSDKNL